MVTNTNLHLKNCDRNYSILRDHEFENSRKQLETKARELRVQGYGKRKNAPHTLYIGEADEESLWSSGLGKHSAQALVNVNLKTSLNTLAFVGDKSTM